MLDEYAITPDTFDPSCYSAINLCPVHLDILRVALMNEAVVRDLRGGRWSQFVWDAISDGRLSVHAKELIEALMNGKRLRRLPAIAPNNPNNYNEWLLEAVQSDSAIPTTGIVASETLAQQHPGHARICSVERLQDAPWWQARSASIQTLRKTADYIQGLQRLLECARSLMFIDPHLDPTRPGYGQFPQMLTACQRTHAPRPQIEIHRVCYVGSGQHRQIIDSKEWEQRFKSTLETTALNEGFRVEVFIWDDFHDRFLITDLMGLSMTNGYDVTTSPLETIVWNRLSRRVSESVQREFDPAATRHALRGRFLVG